jgi:hypothetical protein
MIIPVVTVRLAAKSVKQLISVADFTILPQDVTTYKLKDMC